MAGDFNTKRIEWGSDHNNPRGGEQLDLVASLILLVYNTGSTPTFENRVFSSVIDVTFASISVASKIRNWNVLDKETYSDHNYIMYSTESGPSLRCNTHKGWPRKKLDRDKLSAYLTDHCQPDSVYKLMETLKRTCDAAMPRCSSNNQR